MWLKFSQRDMFQLAAFSALYKTLKEYNEPDLAFVKAVCATSDDMTNEVLRRYPDAIERWEAA